jgi:hypothetical protein
LHLVSSTEITWTRKVDEAYGAPDGLNLRIREGGENDEELRPVDNRFHE